MKPADPIVLIVDDDQMVREGIRSLVRSIGLRALTFASATEFLSAKLPDVPRCLVLDVRMPGQSGLDLHRQLKEAQNEDSNRLYHRSRGYSDDGSRDEAGRYRVPDKARSWSRFTGRRSKRFGS